MKIRNDFSCLVSWAKDQLRPVNVWESLLMLDVIKGIKIIVFGIELILSDLFFCLDFFAQLQVTFNCDSPHLLFKFFS
jgi:hypothetical protein